MTAVIAAAIIGQSQPKTASSVIMGMVNNYKNAKQITAKVESTVSDGKGTVLIVTELSALPPSKLSISQRMISKGKQTAFGQIISDGQRFAYTNPQPNERIAKPFLAESVWLSDGTQQTWRQIYSVGMESLVSINIPMMLIIGRKSDTDHILFKGLKKFGLRQPTVKHGQKVQHISGTYDLTEMKGGSGKFDLYVNNNNELVHWREVESYEGFDEDGRFHKATVTYEHKITTDTKSLINPKRFDLPKRG